MAAAGLAPGLASSASAAPKLSVGTDMYESIGVRPVINAKGVFTMLSGSLMLPECRRAMQQASRNFVHIDELMEAVGKRLPRSPALNRQSSPAAVQPDWPTPPLPVLQGATRRRSIVCPTLRALRMK